MDPLVLMWLVSLADRFYWICFVCLPKATVFARPATQLLIWCQLRNNQEVSTIFNLLKPLNEHVLGGLLRIRLNIAVCSRVVATVSFIKLFSSYLYFLLSLLLFFTSHTSFFSIYALISWLVAIIVCLCACDEALLYSERINPFLCCKLVIRENF